MSESTCRDLEAYLTARIQRSDLLGNHYKKNLRSIKGSLPLFLKRLEESGKLSLFAFEKVSSSCNEEMAQIQQLSHRPEEAMDFLGCFYSLQLITMNLNLLDRLEQENDMVSNRTAVYKDLLLRSEARFSILYSALIRNFIEILSHSEMPLPEFVICHVGARRDQDDIDVGIVHRPGGDLAVLNRVIGRLNQEMYRRATQMHFYLSEHSGSKWFSSSIDDYEKLMDVELKNFVVISQLFGAVPIMGSLALFQEFQERVVRRYTYREGGDNRYYEGFMRGVVEEIRSLVRHQARSGEIVPKVDGLRLAKMIVSARRATLGIVGGHFWNGFQQLRIEDPLLQEEYRHLEEAIAFMESIRFLYQLIFVQEEGIHYADPSSREALDRVAFFMGYRETGSERPSTELLRDYFRYSKRIKEISQVFKEEFKKNVGFIRIFRGLADQGKHEDPNQRIVNMATDYIEMMEGFHHTLPWPEFISFLEEEEATRRRFYQDLNLLSPDSARKILERYVHSMSEDGETLLRFFLCFLTFPERAGMERLEQEMLSIFWKSLRRSSRKRKNLYQGLVEDRSLCREFVRNLPAAHVVVFLVQVRKDKASIKARLMERIVSLSFIYHYRGPLLRRKMNQLLDSGLINEEDLPDTRRLRALSKKTLKNVSSLSTFEARCRALSEYHNIETVRFAFRTVRTKRLSRADYMDNFITRLTVYALQDVGLGALARDKDAFGIYATGGNARGEACENDYDMFVIYDPSRVDGALLNKVVQRIHRELSRLGNMPHHRIAELIGSFGVTLDELAAYLDQGNPEDYIERSELIGSRKVFGGTSLHQRFLERIIRKRLFRDKMSMARSLAQELKDRHAAPFERAGLDLKQGKGGLFDLTLTICLLKACFEIYEPADIRAFQFLVKKDPSHREAYKSLFQERRFLTEVRGILRLTGYNEVIDETMDLRYPAFLKGFSETKKFLDEVSKHMESVAEVSGRLIRDLL